MGERLKVLISAYACEPHKGSEPEVGWQWALQMARFHDVTVVTRANNRAEIEGELRTLGDKERLPKFEYFDLGPRTLALKKKFKLTRFYYTRWQKAVWGMIERLHKSERYDLLHHVTFASHRYPAAIWGHGVPCIWGPIGGIESVPPAFLPRKDVKALVYELGRGAMNFLQNSRMGSLYRRAQRSDLVVACTQEMYDLARKLGCRVELMSSVGIPPGRFPNRELRIRQGPLRILYVGNIIPLKGLDLGLEALAASETDARFTLIGDGDFLEPGRRLTGRLGLEKRVEFLGRLPQPATLAAYPEFDVFLFPSLHDTGGFAVLEAMANYLPVVCLAVGGPGLIVKAGCGVKVPLSDRGRVVGGIAEAIRSYDRNRELLREHGKAARRRVLEDFSWEQKATRMDGLYRTVCGR